MSEQTIRTFVAAEVPESVKETVWDAVEPLRRIHRNGLRWTSLSSWHLTLKFLGDITPAEVQRAAEAVQVVAERALPLRLTVDRWGAFPSPARPRVLWVAVTEGADGLAGAATDLDACLAAAGFPREKKPFHPHVTLARVKDPAAGAKAYKSLVERPLESLSFVVDELVVFRSILDPNGAQYHPLAVCSPGE